MPGHVGDVQQPIHAAQIDECAKLGESAHRSAHHRAFGQLRHPLLSRAPFFFFEHHAPIHHHVFVGRIELNNPALDFLADQFFNFGLVLGAAARSGHERLGADIHAQTALHHFRHHAADGEMLGKSTLQRAPILGTLHLHGRKNIPSAVVARDADQQRIANLYRQLALRPAKHIHRQHAIQFAADIHEDRIRGN